MLTVAEAARRHFLPDLLSVLPRNLVFHQPVHLVPLLSPAISICTGYSSGRGGNGLPPSGPCSGYEKRWPVRAMGDQTHEPGRLKEAVPGRHQAEATCAWASANPFAPTFRGCSMLYSPNSKMTSSPPCPQATDPAAPIVRVRNARCAASLAGAPHSVARAPFASESTPGVLPRPLVLRPSSQGVPFPADDRCHRGSGQAGEHAGSGHVARAQITQSGDTPGARVG
jgi:hypothetical protein